MVTTLLADPIDNVHLHLIGGWGCGGVAKFRDARTSKEIELPPALFDVLAVLALAAKTAGRDRSLGFLTKEDMQKHLRYATNVSPGQRDLIRQVFRVRGQFASAYRDADKGKARSHELLRFFKSMGYKLLIPPKNLRIDFIDSGPEWYLKS